ncbi:hypothetical protein [Bradyrhizobium sp. OAE829]|uniref:hypothetical protein n=1 Tax=Bradyrhizobium sp. OAE829 TaxID=2663807 RepID=UPI001789909A
MTGAKRQRLWRERLRQAKPPSVKLAREAAKAVQTSVSASSQALIEARQEIERLRAQLAAASKAARAADAEQIRLHMENTRLRKLLADSRKAEPEQVAELRRRIERLQADHARRDAAAKAAKTQAAKPVSPVDPDSEVVRLKAIMAYNAWRADRRRATDDR